MIHENSNQNIITPTLSGMVTTRDNSKQNIITQTPSGMVTTRDGPVFYETTPDVKICEDFGAMGLKQDLLRGL
jgi:hypothetical protein